MKKVGAFYGRFSPGPDQTENSIEGQRRYCYAAAKTEDVPILYDYIDRALTGTNDKRPQFLQMIEDAENGKFTHLYVYKTDRFSRDKYDIAVYKHKLRKCGVKIISAAENIPDGPEGIILESVLEGLAEYYSKELSQKVSRGHYDKAKKFKHVGGPIPYGFKISINKDFLIDEDKAPIVQEVFIRYANGEKIESIYNDLNLRGLKTQTKGYFNKNSLHRMFNNKKYIGTYEFVVKNKTYKEKFKFEDIYAEDVLPAIIDKELFLKVGKRMKTNKRKTAKNISPVIFKLSGKLFDGNCGGKMVGDSGTSETGKAHSYYSCINKKLYKKCTTKSVQKDKLELLVVEKTKNNIFKDDVIDFISDCVIKLQEEQKDDSMLQALNNQLSTVKQGLNNLLSAVEKGIFTNTTQERMVSLENQKKDLENSIEIERYKKDAPKIKKEQIIFWLEKFKNGNAHDLEYQSQMIDTFINTVVLYDDKIVIAYNYSGDNDMSEINLKDLSEEVRKGLIKWRIGDSNS